MPEKQRRQPPRNVKLKPKENRLLALKSNGETKGPWKPQQTLRVHLGHVLDGGGDAEVVALGVLELAADALDLVLAGAGPKRGGERAQRARICLKKKKARAIQMKQHSAGKQTPSSSGIPSNGSSATHLTGIATPQWRAPARGSRGE